MLGQTNAKIAGGANVEEIKGTIFLKDETQTSISYSDTYGMYSFKIDKNNFVRASSSSPGGGSDTLYIANGFRSNSQTVSSISLSFGQTYMYSPQTRSGSMVSPNKDFFVLSGLNSNTNIFAIPLTKNGDNYALGTPASFDLQVSSGSNSGFQLHCFLNNNTFAYCITNVIHIFRFQNNELTELKSITLVNSPQNISSYDGKILVLYSGTDTVIDLLDYETELVVKTYTATSQSLGSYCLVYKKYGLFCSTNSNKNYFVLDLDSFTEIVLTKPSSVWTNNAPWIANDFYEVEDNKICIAPNTAPASSSIEYAVFQFDFVNRIMTNISLTPKTPFYSSQTSYLINFYYIEDRLLWGSSAYGNASSTCYEMKENFNIEIIYNDYLYAVKQKVEGE